jgi:hypothetical protein
MTKRLSKGTAHPLGDENHIGCAEWLLFSLSGLVGEIAMPKLLSVFGLALVLALAPTATHAAPQGYLKTEGAKQGGSKGTGIQPEDKLGNTQIQTLMSNKKPKKQPSSGGAAKTTSSGGSKH